MRRHQYGCAICGATQVAIFRNTPMCKECMQAAAAIVRQATRLPPGKPAFTYRAVRRRRQQPELF